MADTILNFDFDECPLLTVDGFEAGLIAGSAEISYDRDGFWSIASISLDGGRTAHYTLEQRVGHEVVQARLPEKFRRSLPAYESKSIVLDAGSPLYSMISDTLEGSWADRVADAIGDDVVERRADAAEFRAEQRREDRAMGWL